MYLNLPIRELDYFKVVVDGRIVKEDDPEDDKHLEEEPKTMLPTK